jgi:peroxiredoxin
MRSLVFALVCFTCAIDASKNEIETLGNFLLALNPATSRVSPARGTPLMQATYMDQEEIKRRQGSGHWSLTDWKGKANSVNGPYGGPIHGTNGVPAVDYDAVRRELKLIMDNPSWDDGSLAPIFIRLAWHSSGTYDAAKGTGGSNGAGMRFDVEAADPENAGLNAARAFLEPIKRKFPGISYSDLWILAAYVGLEHTGGPSIPFTPGRVDHPDDSFWDRNGMTYGRLPAAEKHCCPHIAGQDKLTETDEQGRVKGWEGLCDHIRSEVFYRMGFNDQEIVALLSGGHVYGRCHPTASGYAGKWVEHPTEFSNDYASDMIADDWRLVDNSDTWLDAQGAGELRPAHGNRQYINQKPLKPGEEPEDALQMMLLSDMVLAWDSKFRFYLEKYAENEDWLTEDFGVAFKKLTELGFVQ